MRVVSNCPWCHGTAVNWLGRACSCQTPEGRRPVIFHSDMSKLESPRYGCGVEMYEEACAALESIVADARSRNMLY